MLKCIRKLKTGKSYGTDTITNKILKATQNTLLPIYTELYNLLLNPGTAPFDWLIVKIKPIYKNEGDPMDPNNYRGITIIRCLGKLFTSILHDRIHRYCKTLNLIKPN